MNTELLHQLELSIQLERLSAERLTAVALPGLEQTWKEWLDRRGIGREWFERERKDIQASGHDAATFSLYDEESGGVMSVSLEPQRNVMRMDLSILNKQLAIGEPRFSSSSIEAPFAVQLGTEANNHTFIGRLEHMTARSEAQVVIPLPDIPEDARVIHFSLDKDALPPSPQGLLGRLASITHAGGVFRFLGNI